MEVATKRSKIATKTIYDLPKDMIRYILFNFMVPFQIAQCYRTAKVFRVLTPHQLTIVNSMRTIGVAGAAQSGHIELFRHICKVQKLYSRPSACYSGRIIIESCIEHYNPSCGNHHEILHDLLTRFPSFNLTLVEIQDVLHLIPKHLDLYIEFVKWCGATQSLVEPVIKLGTNTLSIGQYIVKCTIVSRNLRVLQTLQCVFGNRVIQITQYHIDYARDNYRPLSNEFINYLRTNVTK